MNDEITNQQGDILLKRAEKVKGEKLNHLVLAEGSKTGHKHQIIDGNAELYSDKGELFLSVNSDQAILGHEEHKNQVVGKGIYRIEIVQEFDHFAEEARNVAD